MKFENNSTVCFFGDSITHGARWSRRVYEYYRSIGIKLEMYDCGVAGDNSMDAFNRIEKSVMIYQPTDVVIMFGMNDCGRELYNVENVDEACILERRRLIDSSVTNIGRCAEKLNNYGVRVTICSTTLYDELSDLPEPYHTGLDGAICEINERVKQICRKKGYENIDFHSEMLKCQKLCYKSGASIIADDRTHPNIYGNELMALVFLASQGFDVDITYDFDGLSKLASRPFSEWEEKRYKLSQSAKCTDIIKYLYFHSTLSHEQIVEALPYHKAHTSGWFNGLLSGYPIDDSGIRRAQEELVAHTKSVYDAE